MNTDLALPHKMKSLKIALDCLEGLGISGEACLVNTGLTRASVSSLNKEVSIGQELNLYRNIAALDVDMSIGITIGRAYSIENYGIWGLAIQSAETLRSALEIALEFQALTYTFFQYEFFEKNDIATIRLKPIADFGDCQHILADRDMAATVLILKQLLGQALPLLGVQLAHEAGGHKEFYASHYNCPVTFEAREYCVLFPAKYLDLVLPQSDPETAKFCAHECRRLQAEIRNRFSLHEHIHQRLALSLENLPSPENLASELGITYRTLRRRLKQEGTGYQSVVNKVKFEYAKDLIINSNLSFSAISDKLGFTEPGNFTHAFKRWSGQTPRDYQRSKRAADHQ